MITAAKTLSRARPTRCRQAGRSLTAVAGVAVVGLIAAACGSSTPSASSNTNSSATTGVPAASTSGTDSGAKSTDVVDAASNSTIGGSILVNPAGLTVYKFSADSATMSACNGACATAWPPITVPAGSTPKGGSGVGGTFATITRSDGSLQVTYDGSPLYTFAGDSAAGDTNGQNLTIDGGKWTVITVGSTSAPAAHTTPTTTEPPSAGGYGY